VKIVTRRAPKSHNYENITNAVSVDCSSLFIYSRCPIPFNPKQPFTRALHFASFCD